MIPLRSLTSGLSRLISSLNPYQATLSLPALPTQNIETSSSKTARTLNNLFKANHHAHNILQHGTANQLPHLLASAYLLSATPEHLSSLYDDQLQCLEHWVESHEQLVEGDWRDVLGRKEYSRAFVDFFEDRLAATGYEWREMVGEVLFEGERPLGYALLEEGGMPAVSLSAAFEVGSQALGIEALGLAACGWGVLARVFEEEGETMTEGSTEDLEEVLVKMRGDQRLDGHKGRSVDGLLQDAQSKEVVLEYWRGWTTEDLKKSFEDGQRAAVELLVGGQHFDLSMAQLLNASHAVRVLLPIIPSDWHVRLLRQWWLLFVSTYICLGRPTLDGRRTKELDLNARDWRFVTDRALRSKWSTDAQFVKGELIEVAFSGFC